jgi:soluble lytic murein transglycosylase
MKSIEHHRGPWLSGRLGSVCGPMVACGIIAAFGIIAPGGLVAPAVAAPADADARDADVRERFLAAYTTADGSLEANDDDALRAYVLYPYLRAARIERALARAEGEWQEADIAAAEFLTELGTAPVEPALRHAWLASLARRSLWQAFLDHYEAAAATPALECQYFNARIAQSMTEGLAKAIGERWLTPYRLPPECEPAFQWLRAQGALTDELVAERAKLLLDNGQAAFARVIAGRLPQDAASPLLERADFIESPARMLDGLLHDSNREVAPEVVLEAWSRLARNDPEAALTRFAALTDRAATSAQASELALRLAMGLAWDRRPEALDYFARVPSAALDDTALEWQARAAMWAGDWDLVRAAIASMSAPRRAESAWRYWSARAAEQRDEGDAVRSLYAALLDADNYYSAMAAARLGERVVPRVKPLPLDEEKVGDIASQDAFRRVRELALLGLRELATSEWHYGYERLPEDRRLQAIHLAARWEIYDIAVATATSHGWFNDYALLYPRPYANEIAAAVKLTDVERPLLYGVLRQESLFRADAASAAGALGVAQLTYDTARETARRWELPAPKREDLFDPAVNITLGAARVAELLAQFDAQLPVALGAYNAGESAAVRWLPPRAIDSDVWIENIPYNETRSYVRRVLWHSLVFAWLETGRPQSARDWLAKIEGR